MSKPSKAKSAAVAESESAPVLAEYDGTVYTVPTPLDWPLDVLDALEAGRLTDAARALLGEDQYAVFRSKPRTFRDLRDLLDAVTSAGGFDSTGN
ncbi:hypothetical protein GCM10010466_29340 [Planomonospora alba]|uniref:Uncharacterized protein n=1 Tax=Planomonospora alba TaxID=161354 RepID=A0ABP6N502_9ACTN